MPKKKTIIPLVVCLDGEWVDYEREGIDGNSLGSGTGRQNGDGFGTGKEDGPIVFHECWKHEFTMNNGSGYDRDDDFNLPIINRGEWRGFS